MERVVEEAVVLSTVDYGEADRVVTMLTKDRGRLSAFAAGARKSKRRFAGALEPATHLKAMLVETRGDTWRLDGVDVIATFHSLRNELSLIARSAYALELCRELTRDLQPHTDLYAALLSYLALLDGGKAGPTSLLKFELDALSMTGFRPRFAPCALCGNAVGDRPLFEADAGGVVCHNCAPRAPWAVPVGAEVIDGLARLQAGERTPLLPDVRARARDVLNLFIAHHLGHRLKGVDFMAQVGVD